MSKFDFFINLKNFINNKIDSHDFALTDNKINKIEVNPNNIGKSRIYIDFFTDEKLFKSIGIHDDDIYFYFQVKNSKYSSSEIYSYYSGESDFLQGYGFWDMLNDDNWEKIEEISTFLIPKPFIQDNEFLSDLASKLLDIFPGESRDMIHEYTNERNDELTESAEETIDSDLDDFFKNSDVKFHEDGIVSIEAKKLLEHYVKKGVPHFPVNKLMKLVFEDYDAPSGWSESIWEYGNSDLFDSEAFNRNVSVELDNIIEKLYSDKKRATEFSKMVSRIKTKFMPGSRYLLPKDKTKKIEFIVRGFDFKDNKIVVRLLKDLKHKDLKLTEENFYNLLYQPELFKFEDIHNF